MRSAVSLARRTLGRLRAWQKGTQIIEHNRAAERVFSGRTVTTMKSLRQEDVCCGCVYTFQSHSDGLTQVISGCHQQQQQQILLSLFCSVVHYDFLNGRREGWKYLPMTHVALLHALSSEQQSMFVVSPRACSGMSRAKCSLTRDKLRPSRREAERKTSAKQAERV